MSEAAVSEREKWAADQAYRERELRLREAQLELSRQEATSSQWRNPLVLAILAAAIAAAGNAGVAIVNGNLQRDLEDVKSEQTRILEVIKTGNPDKAAENLDFLLKAGLIRNPLQVATLGKFLETRQPGSGPTLPSASGAGSPSPEAPNKEVAEKAVRDIMVLLGQSRFADVWDSRTSDWFKTKVTRDAFLANMTLGRGKLGRLEESKLVSIDHAEHDPTTGYKGSIYAAQFLNTYAGGRFFERIVVIREKDAYKLSGIWGEVADMKR